jgi:hypothetical protein
LFDDVEDQKQFQKIEFFRYFFRVPQEASSAWLKFVHAFQKHPV